MAQKFCMVSVRIRSFSCPSFTASGLNTEIYFVNPNADVGKCGPEKSRYGQFLCSVIASNFFNVLDI